MNQPVSNHFSPVARTILVGGAIVLIILGLKTMAFFWNTAFLAVIITVTLIPLVNWLKSKGLSSGLAALTTVLVLLVVAILVVLLLIYSVGNLIDVFPSYADATSQKFAAITTWFAQHNINVLSEVGLQQKIVGDVFTISTTALSRISSVLSIIALAVVASIFMLFEASHFGAGLSGKFATNSKFIDHVNDWMVSTREFILVSTVLGAVEGSIIAVGLYLLHVPFPIIWGFLFWLLCYIPYLGIWLAVIPPAFLAWINLGASSAGLVLVLYVLVNNVFKLFVLPKVMGDKINASMTVGFLGLFFWGWVLGVLGMLMAYPYTLLVRDVVLTSTNETWLVDLMKKETPKPGE